jgi:hypothetical protein
MRLSLLAILLLAACVAAYSQTVTPRLTTVEPGNGKVGDIIQVNGENLAKTTVAKLYLTDGKTDLVCEVVEQTASLIKFKIPAKAAGRLSLMVLTADKEPKLIEQPVKVSIDE